MNHVRKSVRRCTSLTVVVIFICGSLSTCFFLFKRRSFSTNHNHVNGKIVVPPVLKDMPIPPVYYGDFAAVIEYLHRQSYVTPRNCSATITKIIHQTWKDEMIPLKFKNSVNSVITNHPDWEYWFWTDAVAEDFMRKRFPSYIQLYRNYPKSINRANVIRYFILYEFGGVFADLNIMSLRPLDNLMKFHTFIIPEEHPFHTDIVFGFNRIPLIALMMSIPKHPILRSVIRRLPEYASKRNSLYTAGPMMFDLELTNYENAMAGKSIYSLCEAVYMGKWQDFIPQFLDDHLTIDILKRTCWRKGGNPKKIKHCTHLEARKYKQLPIPSTAYTKIIGQSKEGNDVFQIRDIAGILFKNITAFL
ncbi:uncharacterized protein LOC141911124 [Tubulanus polymorphus]|uniref:uncharacterized protein LOC141911124 n=1 Tax=Tubulanus polymorphus TaxID=672921 RepID=UPI003DA2EFFB